MEVKTFGVTWQGGGGWKGQKTMKRLVVILTLILGACGGATGEPGDPVNPLPDVSFVEDVLPIIDSCAASGCHNSNSFQGGLALDGGCGAVYEALIGRESILWEKANGELAHGGGDALAEDDEEVFFNWIASGYPVDCP